ncbi:coiled-coil domain-containing protein 115-like [Periplaneta americana]|uniref:Vacuolar ATPase assembly protein VMA22 n=1 Tax=Periplaneta americana TaxID=6978 RepID=A0ABQ8TDS1_PERAM|nr:hypothetical protein ANN_05746 [Periplaneta americana]
MADNILEVCKELDSLTIRALELMEEQIKCKLKIEETMKTSCLDLAKARYIMGNRSVSYLQLPTEESDDVAALRTVTSSVETKGNLERTVFELHAVNLVEEKPQKHEQETNVRQRSGGKDKDTSHSKSEENGIVNPTDPIKWFGYLVPQNLRQAQKGFQSALDLVIQSANIQSELEATCNRCEKLVELKSNLTVCKS